MKVKEISPDMSLLNQVFTDMIMYLKKKKTIAECKHVRL